ncbi:hypothetical protein NC651_022267 [Populus alba x Populus x berolinensis]|nr:hypothetical protein NC651_022267 [Populus alba x Populus x berolinensis]
MRSSDEHNNKQTQQTMEVSNQKIKRKLSIKCVGLVAHNEEKGVSKITKELYLSYLLLMITLKLYIRFHFSGYVILDTGPSLRTAQEPQDNPRKDLNDQS